MRLFRLWLGSSGLCSGFKRASGFQGSKNLLKTYILILLIVQPKPRTPCPKAFKNPYRNQEGLQSKTLNPEPHLSAAGPPCGVPRSGGAQPAFAHGASLGFRG